VRLNQKIAANMDLIPPGALAPLVKPRSIDDVAVMALTLSGDGWDDARLRRVAAQLRDSLKEIPDVSEIALIGGRPRQLLVTLDPGRSRPAVLIRLPCATRSCRQRPAPFRRARARTIHHRGCRGMAEGCR
jgi:hypothetical protein